MAPEGAFGGGATGGLSGGMVPGGRAPVASPKPNGPSAKEQEKTLPLELRTAKNAKQAAVALLSTIYNRQQADNPTLQSAASDLLPMRKGRKRKP